MLCFTVLVLVAHGKALAKDSWCSVERVRPPVVKRIEQLAQGVVDDRPYPIRSVRTEGLLPGEGLFDISQKAKQDFPRIHSLACGLRVSGSQAYLETVEAFFKTGVSRYHHNDNPIDETGFFLIFEDYSLVRDDVDPSIRSLMDPWVLRFYEGHMATMMKRALVGRVQTDNWQSHRVKIATAAAVAIAVRSKLARIEPLFHAQFHATIREDGFTEDFHKRDALSYAVYRLQPLLEAALAAESLGASWYGSNVRSNIMLNRALDWLSPYAIGERQHVEFANSTEAYDRVRAEAGMKGHAIAPWNPINARDLFWIVGALDAKFLAVARRLDAFAPLFLAACHGVK